MPTPWKLRAGTMRKNTLNFIIDLLLWLAMLSLLGTGLVIHFVLPAGTGGHGHGGGLQLWGWTRHDFGDLHFWLAFGILTLGLVHVALHWTWVVRTTKRLVVSDDQRVPRDHHGRIPWAGFGFLVLSIGLSGGFLWIASANVTREGKPTPPARAAAHDEMDDHDDCLEHDANHTSGDGWGSMTLADIETEYGVSSDELIRALNLPKTTSPTERLGRLRQAHGFAMSTVREVIDRHRRDTHEP